MKQQPKITVGIMEGRTEINGCLSGSFHGEPFGSLSGRLSARSEAGMIVLLDAARREIHRSPSIRLTPEEASTFSLSNVTIGNQFHWERTEDQTFQGDLMFRLREDGTIAVINEISLEDYLTSVISSEMNAHAPMEFLKAHAMLSRSWLLAALNQKNKLGKRPSTTEKITDGAPRTSVRSHSAAPVGRHPGQKIAHCSTSEDVTSRCREEEVIRWYDREDHDLFDVCADDHCQRYQGITKIVSQQAEEAIRETHGRVITYQSEICDARYSKCCGGLTEEFGTAWDNRGVPYLESISDASISHRLIQTEEEARLWILSDPQTYCNTKDKALLDKVLPDFDRKTETFFRWTVEYRREELEEILREKSGFDFGTLDDIVSLRRGPSGRIFRLRIVGSKKSMVVGKELEIRRWLSRSHLYSSAFVVTFEGGRVILDGAGWGHGVGLCQIGAAVMATRGFSAEEILKHYFRNIELEKVY
jgi:stage II sporulation protein D